MTINDTSPIAHEERHALGTQSLAIPKARSVQDPVAVVGLACRLPGNCNSPVALWDFLERGEIAHNEPPASRFNLKGHFDGSTRPRTMGSPGGMFLENIDPQDIDAQFFGLSQNDATGMDPQQRQLLEVVYEGLENAGISLEALDGQKFGCFVGSYAVGMMSNLSCSSHLTFLAIRLC
jgi:acyl transferase domain-containing protein